MKTYEGEAVEPEGDRGRARSAARITASLVHHVGGIAEACGASAIFVYADALDDARLPLPEKLADKVYYVTKTASEQKTQEERGAGQLRVPNVPLTRTSQAKMAVFLGLSRGLVRPGDVVVCLSGLSGNGSLDTLIVTEVGSEFEMYAIRPGDEKQLRDARPEVVERLLDIAAELGSEGREGKPVGALFVVGDSPRVLSLTRQLILNPFRGYPEEERNVLSPAIEETIKELSTVDGAFIIRGDGVIEACGAYIKVASQEEYELPQGLGARHQAAAAITGVTQAAAVTVSESTGTVSVFRGGRIIVEIEKPRSLGQTRKLVGRPAGDEN
jgi:DNA integrity scanning protein DisA with diadenylate cyclase activity